jgi:outer membrane protein with beta-barrel domain
MWTRALNIWFAIALVLGAAATATAQQQQPPPARTAAQPAQAPAASGTPTYELSGGYQLLHVSDSMFPFGLNVDAARHYGKLGLVGEIGFAIDSEEEAGIEASATAWNFGVGGRWTGFNSGRVWPFAQVLIGAEVLHASVEAAGFDESETETSFMLQPGVGVNFVIADGFGLVGQVDYRRTFFDEPDDVEDSVNNQFRIFIGARMILD